MASLRDSPTPGSSVPGRAEPHYRSSSSGLRQLLLRWQPQSIPGNASLSLRPARQPWSQVCSLMPCTGGVPLGVYRSNHHPKHCHRLFTGHGAPSASASPGMASCSNHPGQELRYVLPGMPTALPSTQGSALSPSLPGDTGI